MHAHVEIIRDRNVLARYLRCDPALHAYALGDLDAFFWPHTSWLADNAENPTALVLRYAPPGSAPAIHALVSSNQPDEIARYAQLLAALVPELPASFEMHLSPDIFALLQSDPRLTELRARWGITRCEDHAKLELPATVPDADLAAHAGNQGIRIEAVAAANQSEAHTIENELREFYDRVYPGNWFDPRMLATDMYLVARDGDLICGAAGVHVFSREYTVAALGNIAIAPSHRRQGLARRITACLCARLRAAGVQIITLNVRGDNAAAIACYESIGFVYTARYVELALRSRTH